MIPYVNGTLSKVTAVGTSDDYEEAATVGTDRWAGTVGIYVAEEIVETLSPGRVDEVKQTRLELPYIVGRLVRRGDTLTYSYEGSPVQRKAGTIAQSPLAGRTRIMLENV